MGTIKLEGCHTAIITPYIQEGRTIDWERFQWLIEEQIRQGVDGIVPVGTTGESPTVTMEEHKELIRVAVETVQGRCKVIAGTGANSTEEALELTHFAKEVGADATLQVTPYYNRPTQEGLYRHFSIIADQCGLPVVLYNIPGRTGCSIEVETIERLVKNTNIVGLKEASGTVERVSQILATCNIQILSGDDALTLPMMAVGAVGVISVASNLVPREVTQMVHYALNGNFIEAKAIHQRLYPLFKALFIETNPSPIKAAMAYRYGIEYSLRLPLVPMTPQNQEKLKSVMKSLGII